MAIFSSIAADMVLGLVGGVENYLG